MQIIKNSAADKKTIKQWINIVNPTKKDINYLKDNFDFHQLDLDDCLDVNHRSKMSAYPHYTFLIFLFPMYDRVKRTIDPSELHIFVSNDFLITVHSGVLSPLVKTFEICQTDDKFQNKCLNQAPEQLLYQIFNKLFVYCFPMLDHITEDIDNVERAIFSGHEKKMVSEILLTRRNIIDFRKIMQPHKKILQKSIENFKKSPIYMMQDTDIYYDDLVDYAKEIWDILENYKERIDALEETNAAMINHKLNDIMKTLTIISVVTFPVTLIAAVFGMNALHAMPFIDHPQGFWMIIGIMIATMITMLSIFKAKRWF